MLLVQGGGSSERYCRILGYAVLSPVPFQKAGNTLT
jgi:hypothetical protein